MHLDGYTSARAVDMLIKARAQPFRHGRGWKNENPGRHPVMRGVMGQPVSKSVHGDAEEDDGATERADCEASRLSIRCISSKAGVRQRLLSLTILRPALSR